MDLAFDPSAWATHNQRWLAHRFALWTTQLDRGDAVEPVDVAEAGTDDDQPAALRLATLFGLSAFETDLVVLATGVDVDGALRDAVARAQGVDAAGPVALDRALATRLLRDAHWDALSPLGPLRHWSLLVVDTTAGQARATLRADERIQHFVTGIAAFDERLDGIARLDDIAPRASVASGRVAALTANVERPLTMLTNAHASPAHRRAARSLCADVFGRDDLRVLRVDAAALPADARQLHALARRIDREAALSRAGVVVDAANDAVVGLVASLQAPVVVLGTLDADRVATASDRRPLRVEVVPNDAGVDVADPVVAALLDRASLQFRVEPDVVEQALASVAGLTDATGIEATLWNALRTGARGGLDDLARRVVGDATFADLVVSPSVDAQLREIASQLEQRRRVHDDWGFAAGTSRGLGLTALFAGESGTGKTMAAEAIANEARLDLYRIDLANVVSKYIGETEKNLAAVFAAAERSGAVLLFDEADALFGKRSDVKDSHDRYANIEVAYLLQRIETYRGLAILTTNQKGAIDRAFLRRIRFVVHFALPDAAARERLWRAQFPPRAPVGDVDFARLAKLQLSGGNIRGIALNAAFRAAADDVPIGHRHVLEAARAEFTKLDRPFAGDAA